jgi:RNA polymerase sigma factor FliA
MSEAVAPTTQPSIDSLITSHLDLVPIIARQVMRSLGVQMNFQEELEGYGREGLVFAAKRFDPTRGIPFRSFANYRIRGSMIDALRKESTLPRKSRERLKQLESTNELNEQASEENAAPAAQSSSASDMDHRLAVHLGNLATAMATGLLAERGHEGESSVAIDDGLSPEEEVSRAELRKLLKSAIATLGDQEQVLINRHYFQGDRFDMVAAELGLSKSWASRIHTRAIAKITKYFNEIDGGLPRSPSAR